MSRGRSALRWLASNLPSSLVTQLRYRAEHRLVRGGSVGDGRGGPSVLFFTVRKCASTMMRQLLADVARRHLDLVPVNLAAYLWDATDVADVYGYLSANATRLFQERGVLYAPLRRHIDTPHLSEARAFAMLRDPRDVVVSAYFSTRFSHRAPANRARQVRFAQQREDATVISLDDWVLQEASRVQPVYAEFRRAFDRRHVITYEDMWRDFDAWMSALGQQLGVKFSQEDCVRYRALAGVDERRGEDSSAHRRKGVPGDFRAKLPPSLAEELTRRFENELHWLYG